MVVDIPKSVSSRMAWHAFWAQKPSHWMHAFFSHALPLSFPLSSAPQILPTPGGAEVRVQNLGRMGRTWSNARGAGYSPVLERIYGLDKPEKRVHPFLGPPRNLVSTVSLPLLRRGDSKTGDQHLILRSSHSSTSREENRNSRPIFPRRRGPARASEKQDPGCKNLPSSDPHPVRVPLELADFFLCPGASLSGARIH